MKLLPPEPAPATTPVVPPAPAVESNAARSRISPSVAIQPNDDVKTAVPVTLPTKTDRQSVPQPLNRETRDQSSPIAPAEGPGGEGVFETRIPAQQKKFNRDLSSATDADFWDDGATDSNSSAEFVDIPVQPEEAASRPIVETTSAAGQNRAPRPLTTSAGRQGPKAIPPRDPWQAQPEPGHVRIAPDDGPLVVE
jgi:hypothetical protein